MIKTRDFFLYILIFAFLLTGIAYTVSSDLRGTSVQLTTSEVLFGTTGPELTVSSVSPETERSAYIARLKAKIARGEGQIMGKPAAVGATEEVVEQVEVEPLARSVQYCAAYTGVSKIVPTWRSGEMTVRFVEGARIVFHTTTEQVLVGSTTEEKILETPVLQLVTPILRSIADTCINDIAVGVTLDGALVLNSDTTRFSYADEQILVGYALDGFPIYGTLDDTSNLDTCGGVDAGLGYRYYLREGEDFMLGCFAGTPAVFDLPSESLNIR